MASAPPPGRAARVVRFVAVHLLRGVWLSTMVLTPLVGFWLASSIAAYQNASQWVALLVGLLLFPLVPVGWEAFHLWRRSRRQVARPPILTRLDRLVLRTLVVNGVFLVLVMWLGRATAFRALAVRGDWMLDGHDGPAASWVRARLLGFADHLDRRRGAERDDDRYGTSDTAPDPWKVKPRVEPTPVPTATQPPKDATGWPLPDEPDPAIANMPDDAQASIETVGAYIHDHFQDKKLRVKAIHDYVALRLTYDDDGLAKFQAGSAARPPQDAVSVFGARTAVCEGYARLVVAIGKAANVEVAYVTGWIRDSERRLAASDDTAKAALHGYLHAWNAVLIDDEWFLLDATWDDPSGAKIPVRSTYLFTPPALFAYDHLPEDPAWQLVMSPISLGDFARQPFLSPDIGRLGVTLESPKRSQVTAHGSVTIELANPYAANISAVARLDDGHRSEGTRCRVDTRDRRTTVTCELDDGEYEVSLYGSPAASQGWLEHIGSILVNNH